MIKEYLTESEIIDYLIKNKNVDPSTICNKVFEEEPYVNLIKPYSLLLSNGKNNDTQKYQYPENFNFEHHLECKKIDNYLSLAYRIVIGCFEKRLKCFLANKISLKMAEHGDKEAKDFSWIDNYINGQKTFDFIDINLKEEKNDNSIPESINEAQIERRKKVLQNIKDISNGSVSKTTIITKHYYEQYGYIPFYIAVLNLSLGDLVSLFEILNYEDRNEFICQYKNKEKKYESAKINKYMKDFIRLTTIRNIVSHYDPFVAYFLTSVDDTLGKIALKPFCDMTSDLISHFRNSKTAFIKIPEVPSFNIPINPFSHKNINKINTLLNCFK